jgi:signal transduction histidine kinase
LLGYVFVISTPKLQRKDALYPELFTKGKPIAIENSNTYAFALYNNGHLTSSYNDYPFASVVDIQKNKVQTFNVVKNDDYTELWYYAGAGKMVVIAKENNSFVAFITLFSYLFCTFLIVFVLLWTIQRLSNRIDFNYFKFWQISIRNQIHGTIFLVSIISFLVIGIATVFFFVNRYESNNREKLSRVIRIMEKEIKSTFLNETMAQDSSVLDLSANKIKLEQLVEKVSNIHGVDVNLYDLNGDLQVSSLSLPYNKGILSTKMNPLAFYHLHKKREIQFFQKEKIGNLNYISSYIPINSVNGDSYGYLNIPFFTSQNLLRQEISNFLITIINLNAFIFLLAGIVSLFITNRIANSFSIITEKMQKVNLGKVNEPIKWNRNDEIGALVIEYNKMMAKLEESAAILAKTEREGAWKEMARQVAHEIKNPLTPMKLSMQYLQKSIDNDSPNIIPLAKNVSETLIQQIDHLSNIANAFSQFANIGEAKKEVFDINEVLKNVSMLHELNESLEIKKILIDTPTMVKADKTQINRLFTNLLLNAIQSIPEDRTPQITIEQQIKSDKIIIAISDNGLGISEEVKYNIFAPNFTTKTSGTGLGLAMCKRILEQSDGEIWFETELGVGTTFFVKLPLVG